VSAVLYNSFFRGVLLMGATASIVSELASEVKRGKTYVDIETGEVIELDGDHKPKKGSRAPWFFIGKKGGFKKLGRLRLTSSDLWVFLEVLGRLQYGNQIQINQTAWAKDMGISRQSINSAFATLEKHKIVTRQVRGKLTTSYYVNPDYCWCGDSIDQQKIQGRKK
jgi:hypothetical protein